MHQPESSLRSWADADTVRTVAYWIVAIAGTWWMLRELQSVLRPLLLAAFLAYMFLPYYRRLRTTLPASVVIGLFASITALTLVIAAISIYGSVLGLSDELPEMQRKLVRTWQGVESTIQHYKTEWKAGWLGAFLPDEAAEPPTPPNTRWVSRMTENLTLLMSNLLSLAAGGFLEAAATVLYLLFLLIGAERFPGRVRSAYPPEQAEQILDVAGRINSAIVSYLKAKVKSSVVLAVPIGLVLLLFNVKFAILWVVLTFLCNFIPYIGSIAAYILPVLFSYLQLGFGWPFLTVATLMMMWHLVCAMFLEPMLIGKAVGISPLLILATLSLWGLLWGLPGMFLAVPLTVVMKIIFENIAATRSVALLLMEE